MTYARIARCNALGEEMIEDCLFLALGVTGKDVSRRVRVFPSSVDCLSSTIVGDYSACCGSSDGNKTGCSLGIRSFDFILRICFFSGFFGTFHALNNLTILSTSEKFVVSVGLIYCLT